MSRVMGYRWHLRLKMAERGMFATTGLRPLLAERGVVLSREQVYRLVTGVPERLSLRTLAALCDILDCTPAGLVEPVAEAGRGPRRAAVPAGPAAGTKVPRPVRPDTADLQQGRARRPGHLQQLLAAPGRGLRRVRLRASLLRRGRWPAGLHPVHAAALGAGLSALRPPRAGCGELAGGPGLRRVLCGSAGAAGHLRRLRAASQAGGTARSGGGDLRQLLRNRPSRARVRRLRHRGQAL